MPLRNFWWKAPRHSGVKNCPVCERNGVRGSSASALCYDCWRVIGFFQKRAMSSVAAAVARQELPRARSLVCADCGVTARDYDHRDYTEPLCVEPTCRSCNLRRGPAILPGQIQHFIVEAAHASQ